MLQVDFANKVIGGGVLRYGCVQEEIRFVINPELLASRLFVQEMEANEVVVIVGSERFSSYKGYADSFAWAGDYVDTTPRDERGRRKTEIVAMDALQLSGSFASQYLPGNVERELNKAYCGFYVPLPDVDVDADVAMKDVEAAKLAPVATGHWGCGVFGGDKALKSILQWAAASVVGREIVYFTFADDIFANLMASIIKIFTDNNVTIKDALEAVQEYAALLQDAKSSLELFSYLEARFS
eukprot:TRINITY_DN9347_c0_g1_i1.p2 TRINITY_DN9347_c0_g1~~TRINITY_DN9347_c0_g1_i1.p2  ORF type:complete len:240 (-),score=63.97 TRINITY_DN9347_c0_g1_i1:1571-2290(-)